LIANLPRNCHWEDYGKVTKNIFGEQAGGRTVFCKGMRFMTLEDRLQLPLANDILEEHLGYSADLVALALREISEAPHDDKWREWYRRMSIIEVFWGQARILVEFFTGALASTTTSAAEHFTKSKVYYDFAFGDKDIKRMMND
jgi:hypothetical protein